MMVDERIARRRRDVREDRRRRRLQRTVVAAVLLAVAVALLVVERSPLVALAEVRVTGTDVLDPGEVVAAADLSLGTSLLRMPLAAARERVEALPRVREADVVRVDPVTVEIRVTERVATLEARRGTNSVVVDEDGIVLARGGADGLSLVVVRDGPLPAPGESVSSNRALANAVAFDRDLPGPTRSLVRAIRAEDEDRAVLVLSSGIRVEVGRADQVEAKARALAAVLEDIDGREVASIDVRAPSAPVMDETDE